jgi:hypothetical protein
LGLTAQYAWGKIARSPVAADDASAWLRALAIAVLIIGVMVVGTILNYSDAIEYLRAIVFRWRLRSLRSARMEGPAIAGMSAQEMTSYC